LESDFFVTVWDDTEAAAIDKRIYRKIVFVMVHEFQKSGLKIGFMQEFLKVNEAINFFIHG